MKNYYLYHYYESELGPFKNLSEQPPEEANEIMTKLKQEGLVFASKRSDDYMLIRRDLEEKAKMMFVHKGGKPTKNFPHYMTLGPCTWIKQWYKEGKELQINLNDFEPDIISFTYGDLFPTMRYKDGKPYREKLYRIEEMAEIIEQYGMPQEWNRDGSKGPERYIEVQVWDDKVINKYLK
ncbi:hypothetical protein SAMN03159341_101728 [Paenibacillus sp. 1_12]|uniref:hypothetical protein n=1 Tax=Paenibacillus sp. 1_12 TaxID=1566278 RepID=UPI0008E565B7|nr:hypothetical protein [Paenibacillus sp. 1_12]SFK82082.1 hypothetical protein SAMN03159341_101728 [Paenibacillus sp. 1_12]